MELGCSLTAGKLGQRDLPEATGWVCGTVMCKPEDFLNLILFFFFFFSLLPFQKGPELLHNLILADTHISESLCCVLGETSAPETVSQPRFWWVVRL